LPIDNPQLIEALRAVQSVYDPTTTSVRTGRVIAPLHEYCAYELCRTTFAGNHLPIEHVHPAPPARAEARSRIRRGTHESKPKRLRILGAYMPKEVDVLLVDLKASPPRVIPDFPSPKTQPMLRIENFFDRLVQLYFERNQFV
jgi:hypothetical protein